MYFLFLVSLAGYTLVHFGRIYEGHEPWDYTRINIWWYLLAACHGYMCLILAAKGLQAIEYLKKVAVQTKWLERKFTYVLR